MHALKACKRRNQASDSLTCKGQSSSVGHACKTPWALSSHRLPVSHSMLAVQFDYNVGSTLEGLDLAFGLTMAIVVCHRSRVDCTNLAHGRKQAQEAAC